MIAIPTPGVDPLKNFAMSAAVPLGTYFGPCAATVTTIREDRSTSPSAPLCATQPAPFAFAITPYPGPASASSFRRLRLTRTTFGAYGSTSTVASARFRLNCCAPRAHPTDSQQPNDNNSHIHARFLFSNETRDPLTPNTADGLIRGFVPASRIPRGIEFAVLDRFSKLFPNLSSRRKVKQREYPFARKNLVPMPQLSKSFPMAVLFSAECLTPAQASRPRMASALSPDRRADLVLEQMTLEENLQLVLADSAVGIRVATPESRYATPALPSTVALAATWDISVVQLCGEVIGRELARPRASTGPSDAESTSFAIPATGVASITLTKTPSLLERLSAASLLASSPSTSLGNIKHYALNERFHS